MNVIKQMEYGNKMGEDLVKLADGVVNGFRFVILSNNVFPIVRIYCDVRSQYAEAFRGLVNDRAFTSALMNSRRPRTEVPQSKMGYSMQWNFNKIGDYVGDKEETYVTGRVWNVPDLYAFVADTTEKITYALSGKDLNDVDFEAFDNVVFKVNKNLKLLTGSDETFEITANDKRYTVAYRGFTVVRGTARVCYNTLMSISSVLFSVVKANGLIKNNTAEVKDVKNEKSVDVKNNKTVKETHDIKDVIVEAEEQADNFEIKKFREMLTELRGSIDDMKVVLQTSESEGDTDEFAKIADAIEHLIKDAEDIEAKIDSQSN